MASVLATPTGWKATVRRIGHKQQSKTFRLKADADAWAAEVEATLHRSAAYDFSTLRKSTVRDVLTRFRNEVSPKRKGYKWEVNRIDSYLREHWADYRLSDDIPSALREWRDIRSKTVASTSIIRDLGLLGGIFRHAIREWGIPLADNPIHRVQPPERTGHGERDQVWTEANLAAYVEHIGFKTTVEPRGWRDMVVWGMLILRTTGLRLSEMCRITPDMIDLSTPAIRFETTKNGDMYNCPLRTDAKATVSALLKWRSRPREQQAWDGDRAKLIGMSPLVFGENFRRLRAEVAVEHPEVKELVLHALRHTFTTQLAAKVKDPMTLMRITGRRSIASLTRYYRPSAGDLAKLMD